MLMEREMTKYDDVNELEELWIHSNIKMEETGLLLDTFVQNYFNRRGIHLLVIIFHFVSSRPLSRAITTFLKTV